MTSSVTVSNSTTFTITHARHLATKVSTDLLRIQRFYGEPSNLWIDAYEEELIQLLAAGFLGKVTYGFKRDGVFCEPTVVYTAQDLQGDVGTDEDPGGIRPGASIAGASFGSYLTYSLSWLFLADVDQEKFQEQLPFKRTNGVEPGVDGYLRSDRTYSAGGRALGRSSLRNLT